MATFKLSNYQDENGKYDFMQLIDAVTLFSKEEVNANVPIDIYVDVPGEHHLTHELCIENGNDVLIHGKRSEKTTIIIENNFEFKIANKVVNGITTYASGDDALFYIYGKADHWVSVEISDLTVQVKIKSEDLASLPQQLNSGAYIFKSYYAKGWKLHDVNVVVENVVLTAVNLRACADVTIVNNTFTCLNRRKDGDIIDFFGEVHGVHIINNTFSKFGNGSIIKFFNTNKTGTSEPEVIVKENILIEGNSLTIISKTEGEGSWTSSDWGTMSMDNVIALQAQQAAGVKFVMRNVRITRNEFHLNYRIRKLVDITCCSGTIAQNIMIDHNLIKYGQWRAWNSRLIQFNVKYGYLSGAMDGSFCASPVVIAHNKLVSHCFVANKAPADTNMTENHYFLTVSGWATHVCGNEIVIDNETMLSRTVYTDGTEDTAVPLVPIGNDGILMFYCDSQNGRVRALLKGNRIKGMRYMGSFAGNNGALLEVNLNICDNFITGNTSSYIKNVAKSDIAISGNTLQCTYHVIAIDSCAADGSVVFERNVVENYDTTRVAHLYLYGTAGLAFTPTRMSFNSIGNVFVNEKTNYINSGISTLGNTLFLKRGNVYMNNVSD